MLQNYKRGLRSLIEKNDFNPSFAGLLVNPFWLSRRALSRALSAYAPRLSGKVLDFGCGTAPYRHMLTSAKTYLGIEYDSPENRLHKRADIFYDGQTIPLNPALLTVYFLRKALNMCPIPTTSHRNGREYYGPVGYCCSLYPSCGQSMRCRMISNDTAPMGCETC